MTGLNRFSESELECVHVFNDNVMRITDKFLESLQVTICPPFSGMMRSTVEMIKFS